MFGSISWFRQIVDSVCVLANKPTVDNRSAIFLTCRVVIKSCNASKGLAELWQKAWTRKTTPMPECMRAYVACIATVVPRGGPQK